MRAVTEKLYEHAQQSGAKLVHIPQAELLTEAAANALLKTLEEPTENTWFVLQSQERSNCCRHCAAAVLLIIWHRRQRIPVYSGCNAGIRSLMRCRGRRR